MKKKWVSILLCALAALAVCALTACGNRMAPTAQTAAGTASPENAQLANPFVDCDTMGDAEKLAGFAFTVPETVQGYNGRKIQAVEGEMIQVVYTAPGGEKLMLRKGKGTGDISGDYNTYTEVNTVAVGDRQVTEKGENGTVSVAAWADQSNTYAVETQDAPLTTDAAKALIETIG